MDSSPPGSSIHRILHTGILEWVAISFSIFTGEEIETQGWLVTCFEIKQSVGEPGFEALSQCFACICAQLCLTLQPSGLQPTRFLCPWDSPGKTTGVSCHFPLQGIFPDQGSNPPRLLRWQVGAFPLSPLGSPCAAIICYYSDSCTWLCQISMSCPVPDAIS